MKAKEYLEQAYRLDELIMANKKELKNLEMLKVSLPGTDYSKERVQTSNSSDARYTEIIAKIDELERVIKDDIERMLSLKLEIKETIDSVKDNEERLVLNLRYINFLKWNKIHESMHISKRTVERIHNNALKNVKIPKIS